MPPLVEDSPRGSSSATGASDWSAVKAVPSPHQPQVHQLHSAKYSKIYTGLPNLEREREIQDRTGAAHSRRSADWPALKDRSASKSKVEPSARRGHSAPLQFQQGTPTAAGMYSRGWDTASMASASFEPQADISMFLWESESQVGQQDTNGKQSGDVEMWSAEGNNPMSTDDGEVRANAQAVASSPFNVGVSSPAMVFSSQGAGTHVPSSKKGRSAHRKALFKKSPSSSTRTASVQASPPPQQDAGRTPLPDLNAPPPGTNSGALNGASHEEPCTPVEAPFSGRQAYYVCSPMGASTGSLNLEDGWVRNLDLHPPSPPDMGAPPVLSAPGANFDLNSAPVEPGWRSNFLDPDKPVPDRGFEPPFPERRAQGSAFMFSAGAAKSGRGQEGREGLMNTPGEAAKELRRLESAAPVLPSRTSTSNRPSSRSGPISLGSSSSKSHRDSSSSRSRERGREAEPPPVQGPGFLPQHDSASASPWPMEQAHAPRHSSPSRRQDSGSASADQSYPDARGMRYQSPSRMGHSDPLGISPIPSAHMHSRHASPGGRSRSAQGHPEGAAGSSRGVPSPARESERGERDSRRERERERERERGRSPLRVERGVTDQCVPTERGVHSKRGDNLQRGSSPVPRSSSGSKDNREMNPHWERHGASPSRTLDALRGGRPATADGMRVPPGVPGSGIRSSSPDVYRRSSGSPYDEISAIGQRYASPGRGRPPSPSQRAVDPGEQTRGRWGERRSSSAPRVRVSSSGGVPLEHRDTVVGGGRAGDLWAGGMSVLSRSADWVQRMQGTPTRERTSHLSKSMPEMPKAASDSLRTTTQSDRSKPGAPRVSSYADDLGTGGRGPQLPSRPRTAGAGVPGLAAMQGVPARVNPSPGRPSSPSPIRPPSPRVFGKLFGLFQEPESPTVGRFPSQFGGSAAGMPDLNVPRAPSPSQRQASTERVGERRSESQSRSSRGRESPSRSSKERAPSPGRGSSPQVHRGHSNHGQESAPVLVFGANMSAAPGAPKTHRSKGSHSRRGQTSSREAGLEERVQRLSLQSDSARGLSSSGAGAACQMDGLQQEVQNLSLGRSHGFPAVAPPGYMARPPSPSRASPGRSKGSVAQGYRPEGMGASAGDHCRSEAAPQPFVQQSSFQGDSMNPGGTPDLQGVINSEGLSAALLFPRNEGVSNPRKKPKARRLQSRSGSGAKVQMQGMGSSENFLFGSAAGQGAFTSSTGSGPGIAPQQAFVFGQGQSVASQGVPPFVFGQPLTPTSGMSGVYGSAHQQSAIGSGDQGHAFAPLLFSQASAAPSSAPGPVPPPSPLVFGTPQAQAQGTGTPAPGQAPFVFGQSSQYVQTSLDTNMEPVMPGSGAMSHSPGHGKQSYSAQAESGSSVPVGTGERTREEGRHKGRRRGLGLAEGLSSLLGDSPDAGLRPSETSNGVAAGEDESGEIRFDAPGMGLAQGRGPAGVRAEQVAAQLAQMGLGSGHNTSREQQPAAEADKTHEVRLQFGMMGLSPSGEQSATRQGFAFEHLPAGNDGGAARSSDAQEGFSFGAAANLGHDADTHTQFIFRAGSQTSSGMEPESYETQGQQHQTQGHHAQGPPIFSAFSYSSGSDGAALKASAQGSSARRRRGSRHRGLPTSRHSGTAPSSAQFVGTPESKAPRDASSLDTGMLSQFSIPLPANWNMSHDVGTMEGPQPSAPSGSGEPLAPLERPAPKAKVPVFVSSTRSAASEARSFSNTVNQAVADSAEKTCLKCRQKGNVAYQKADYTNAEDQYTKGIKTALVYAHEAVGCARAAALCYSNRAATRIVVGRHREALDDCRQAQTLDPAFTRATVRAASCHLALGELEAAAALYEECLRAPETQPRRGRAPKGDEAEHKHAQEGLHKVREAQSSLGKGRSLLLQRRKDLVCTPVCLSSVNLQADGLLSSGNGGMERSGSHGAEGEGGGGGADPEQVLKRVSKSLVAAQHSEELLMLKAEMLLWCRKYEDAVSLCASTLASAQQNRGHAASMPPFTANPAVPRVSEADPVVWRLRVQARARFGMGQMEDALALLQEGAGKGGPHMGEDRLEGTIRELLRLKASGNAAYQTNKHAEAVSFYSECLLRPEMAECWPFQAVCLCNRAAACQAMGDLPDAIADCSRAIALEPKYMKAISRRATLSEVIRDFSRVVTDLRRLLELHERAQRRGSGAGGGTIGASVRVDVAETQARISRAEEEHRRGTPVDHYLLLGLDMSCSGAEVKKAYRKAALRFHPDKVARLVAARVDTSVVWGRQVEQQEQQEFERLFKLIAEAHNVLSDDSKRAKYDAEERARRMRSHESCTAYYQAPGASARHGRGTGHATGARRRNWEGQGWEDVYGEQVDPRQGWYSSAHPQSGFGWSPRRNGRNNWS